MTMTTNNSEHVRAAGQVDVQDGTEQYLTFKLAGEEYGVDILRVQEIKGWEHATRLPQSPHYVLGVMNLRGAVVPILELRRRFSLESVAFGATTVVIVVKASGPRGERTVGLVVDAVCEVYHVSIKDMKPPPEVGSTVNSAFVKGLSTIDEKMIILLDLDRLIKDSLMDGVEDVAA
jgi:purine-binding chemotaxis protein CheW